MGTENRLRALYLLKILYERTDDNHPLTTSELIKIMEDEYGFHVYRTTVAKDIDQLKQFGIDINTVRTAQNRYYVNNRLFDITELKLLIDAVKSSKVITDRKSRELVEKLGTLASNIKASELKRNLCIEGRIKPVNEQIYYIVDALNDAINLRKKVSFQYFQYNVKKEIKLRNDGEVYYFSPYTLVWNGDYYYVVGYSDKHNGIGSFRVDRIYSQPKIMKEDAVQLPDGFNETEYIKTMFRMYNKETETVELICDNEIMDTIVDKFGENVKTYAYGLSSFKAVVEVAASHVFYSWVFGFGGRVKISGPQKIKDEYNNMIKEAAAKI